jgi:hypothetical protein
VFESRLGHECFYIPVILLIAKIRQILGVCYKLGPLSPDIWLIIPEKLFPDKSVRVNPADASQISCGMGACLWIWFMDFVNNSSHSQWLYRTEEVCVKILPSSDLILVWCFTKALNFTYLTFFPFYNLSSFGYWESLKRLVKILEKFYNEELNFGEVELPRKQELLICLWYPAHYFSESTRINYCTNKVGIHFHKSKEYESYSVEFLGLVPRYYVLIHRAGGLSTDSSYMLERWRWCGIWTTMHATLTESSRDSSQSFRTNTGILRGCIQKFPDWINNEIYAYNNKHSLRINTKCYGSKTH